MPQKRELDSISDGPALAEPRAKRHQITNPHHPKAPQKRQLDSISDGPALSEPRAKRRRITNRRHITDLPDELLILVAEHLAGYDDPTTYVARENGKIVIDPPKNSRDVSLAGLHQLSDVLFVEYQKAQHRNGIITFEDQQAYAEYFNPEILERNPSLATARLATERIRFIRWRLPEMLQFYEGLQVPPNVKKVHLGGGWKGKEGKLLITPSLVWQTPDPDESFYFQSISFAIATSPFLANRKNGLRSITLGPGRFGHNTVHDIHYSEISPDIEDPETFAAKGYNLRVLDRTDPLNTIPNDNIIPMPDEELTEEMKSIQNEWEYEQSKREFERVMRQFDAAERETERELAKYGITYETTEDD
ncbi:hypothetical protein SLS54_006426 [Diplodia seriata]